MAAQEYVRKVIEQRQLVWGDLLMIVMLSRPVQVEKVLLKTAREVLVRNNSRAREASHEHPPAFAFGARRVDIAVLATLQQVTLVTGSSDRSTAMGVVPGQPVE